MSFNKENKITIKELAPSLIELLKGSTNKNEFLAHVNNHDIHITPEERKAWNKMADDAKSYTDVKVGEITNALAEIGGSTGNISEAIKSLLPRSEFDDLKSKLHQISFTGSYNDLKDKPSGVNYSDNANYADRAGKAAKADVATKAEVAERAIIADSAKSVNGVSLTIGPTFPSNPANNKNMHYHTTKFNLYFYVNGEWRMTGAALRAKNW